MLDPIVGGILSAFRLIVSADAELVSIVGLTAAISGAATLLAGLWSMPISIVLGLRRFRRRNLLKSMMNALMGMPTVALGTILYLILCRNGPLGFLNLLYTPYAMVIGEAILITPIATSLVVGALEAVDPEIRLLAMTLGASEGRAELAVLREARKGVALAITASFGRAISELGVALMVGGNIPGSTRVLTTAIAVGIGRGDLETGIAFTFILLAIVACVTLVTNHLSRKD